MASVSGEGDALLSNQRTGSKRRKRGKNLSLFEVVSPGRCGPGEHVTTPRSKRSGGAGRHSPLPLQQDRSRQGRVRKRAAGVFAGQCVLVQAPEDMLLLHSEGCFGKGNMSRAGPRLAEQGNASGGGGRNKGRKGRKNKKPGRDDTAKEEDAVSGASSKGNEPPPLQRAVKECLQLSLVEVTTPLLSRNFE